MSLRKANQYGLTCSHLNHRVQTLESALNDTERILRKARMQMNDLVRERDTHEKENASLKKQTQDVNAELESLRQSLASARRESDTRLMAERSQRDAARVELEQRLEAMRAKKSKYNVSCLGGLALSMLIKRVVLLKGY